MRTFVLSLLMASTVLGQTTETTRVSKGDLLKQRQYQTNAALTFFVDPTGNDANACTASGTNACLTIQGALNKAPKLLRHNVTVNVAAGNYAGFIISGFTVDPSVQKTTAGILINGVLGNVTPTTGSATGTATAGSAGALATAVFGTLTDSGATWTVNDAALVGKLITITGGTGSGQVRVVCSNTATVITICGTWTAPTGTSTYALQAPTSIITSTTAAVPNSISGGIGGVGAAGIQIVDNNTPGTSLTSIQNIGIAVTTANSGLIAQSNTGFNLTAVVATCSQFAITTGSSTVSTFTALSLTGSGAALAVNAARLTVSNSYINSTATGITPQVIGAFVSTVGTKIVVTNAIANQGFNITQGGTASLSGVQIDCSSTATSSALSLGATQSLIASATNDARNQAVIGNTLNITNCGVGIWANQGSVVNLNSTAAITGNALSYAIEALNGSSVTLSTALAITSGTADLNLDNASVTGSFASLTGIYSCLATLGTGSNICRL